LAAIALLVGEKVFWVWINSYVEPSIPAERADLVGKAAQIAGGILVAIGVYWTAKNVHVSREGQITERFTRAIDQLGSVDGEGRPKLEIRLGAIYALERIARDSARDHRTIMEVLTAYVRQNAPVPSGRREEWEELAGQAPHAARRGREGGRAPADIQAIGDVLGRRRRTADRGEPMPLDLDACDLRDVRFGRAYLRRVNLIGSDLEGAMFGGADLRDALMLGANLRGATLSGADLRDAWLQDSVVSEAALSSTDLRGTNIYGSRFDGARFWQTRAEGVGFHHNRLDHASFYEAHLEYSQFGEDTTLDQTSFTKCFMQHANLRGVDLSRVRELTREQLAPAATDEHTKLPPYLQKPGASDETIEPPADIVWGQDEGADEEDPPQQKPETVEAS
jgi:hypothetical protein